MLDLSAWRQAGREYRHHDQPIRYLEQGSGEALLLIHGFPTAAWDFAPILDALVARYRVIAPDLIGFGDSAKPRNYDYSIFDQADLLEGLLAACGVERVHILAHDYGDTVAQELLARHQDRRRAGAVGLVVASVCFLNGGLFPEVHRARPVQKLLNSPLGSLMALGLNRQRFEQSFAAVFAPDKAPGPADMQAFWELVSGNSGTRIAHKLIRYIRERRRNRPRWVGALIHNAVPLCFINGAQDPVSGEHMRQRYAELVPNANTVSLPEAGHYPQYEAPQAVADAYLAFRDGLEKSR